MEGDSEDNKAPQPKAWPYMNVVSLTTSFALKFVTVGLIWGWGYMNWSVAWLLGPIALSVWKSERQKDRNLKAILAQANAIAEEKHFISNRIDELPSWVYFPDYDRAEWLNRVLCKVWPNVNHFARGIFRDVIQPSVIQSLAEYKIKGFQFDRMVLGRIPPKIYGIKVYDKNTSRNEIVLDADIMYAGDCDIKFSVGNIRGGIRDLQIRGVLRVVMKPIISVMPLVGGLQVFFLDNPNITYNLVGVADVLDFPGFSEILRKTIVQQVAARVVLPNKIFISLSDQIPAETLKFPEPEGVLRIHVVEAKHLMKKDIGMLGKGKSDPYAVVSVGAQEFRTKTIDNTVDPKWDFWCEFTVADGSGSYNKLIVQLFDKDNAGQDDPLGRATIEVNRAKKKGTIDTWVSLEHAKHGMVHLRMTWLGLSKNVGDLQAALIETQQLRVTSMSTAMLIIYVDSAKNLPCVRGNKQPDVYLEARIAGKTERTATVLRSCDPIWEQGFTFLVGNPETGVLHVKITDEKTALVVGEMSYNVSTLMGKNNLEVGQQPYDLQMAEADSKLFMSMSLSILKYEEPVATSEDDEEDYDIVDLNKRIERQESDVASVLSSGLTSSPLLKKQFSKESVNSLTQSTASGVVGGAAAGGAAAGGAAAEPVEEEPIVAVSAATSLESSPQLVQRHPSVTSSAGEANLGRIQLTVRYSVPRQKLLVTVHKIANLPLPQNDPRNVPDPYVKLYLLPDRHKETKRKTVVMKDNCNPTFDEEFEYVISQGDLYSRTLEVSVCTQKAWLSTGSNVMGQVLLRLQEIDLTKAVSSWFDLMPEHKD